MVATLSLALLLTQQLEVPTAISKSSKPNCRELAEAANYYIGLGEETAAGSLLRIAKAKPGSKAGRRAALMCRILFQPKGKRALNAPRFGDISLPVRSMPLSSWPEFPLAQEAGVWFLLEENYRSDTPPQSHDAYIEYCQKDGKFRTERLLVPTSQEAQDALKSLLASKRWNAIHWSDGDLRSSYTYDRGWTMDILTTQTRFRD